MQFLSLNVEGLRHTADVQQLIADKSPDIICLQEVPEALVQALRTQAYHVTFEPLTIRTQDGEQFPEGILIASRIPHTATTYFYHMAADTLQEFDKSHYRETMRKAVLMAECEGFKIGTTHFTWTLNGETADEFQRTDFAALAPYIDTLPAHILCGDLNIPRFHNELYSELVARYTDAIPLIYHSSLDPAHHRCGADPTKQHLFTDFMVDYLLTQPPFSAEAVELIFGVSDHAAISALLTIE